MMYVRTRDGPPHDRAAAAYVAARSGLTLPLLLDPPLLDVPVRVRAKGTGLDATDVGRGREDAVLREAEHVRRVVVQDLVHLLVGLLTRSQRAVRTVTAGLDELV